jgi:valyl-tRNA synthetase
VTGEAARWILSRSDAAVVEATRLIDGYLFGEYLVALEAFIWAELADIYVELAKPSLRGPEAVEAVQALAYVLDRMLRLLHPSMPFITETIALQLWKRAGKSEGTPSLAVSLWPQGGERDPALEERFGAFIEVVRAIRNVRQEGGLDPSARVKVSLAGETSAVRDLLKQIGDLTHSEVSLGKGEGTATVVRAIEIRLVVERDEKEERARLERDLEEAKQVLTRSQDLLAKPGFADKAPKDVVEREKTKLKEREQRLKLLEAELRKRQS